jgi:hypothetical protein
MYYSFTSLSTVGLGDFCPQSNAERIFSILILLLAVVIFLYIMSNFIDMIQSYKSINEDLDDGHQLSKFFSLLKSFNNGKSIDNDFKSNL